MNVWCEEWMDDMKRLSPRGLRWGDKQKQLQMLMPIRNEANVWGTKRRESTNIVPVCCVPRPATRPILVVCLGHQQWKCKYGSAELFYLGQVICTQCVSRLSIRKRTWSLLACFEGCGTCHKSCSFHFRRINRGSSGALPFPHHSQALAYAQNHHPSLALSELDCSHQRGFFRTPCLIQHFCQPEGLEACNEWLLCCGPSVTRLIHLTDWLKNLDFGCRLLFLGKTQYP